MSLRPLKEVEPGHPAGLLCCRQISWRGTSCCRGASHREDRRSPRQCCKCDYRNRSDQPSRYHAVNVVSGIYLAGVPRGSAVDAILLNLADVAEL